MNTGTWAHKLTIPEGCLADTDKARKEFRTYANCLLSGDCERWVSTERRDYLAILSEVASALGTVGLSMGLTGDLTDRGKWIVAAIMFIGRLGPLTLGLALFHSPCESLEHIGADLAT